MIEATKKYLTALGAVFTTTDKRLDVGFLCGRMEAFVFQRHDSAADLHSQHIFVQYRYTHIVNLLLRNFWLEAKLDDVNEGHFDESTDVVKQDGVETVI